MTLVDTNVLIDVISKDAKWFDWSVTMLKERSDRGALVINDIVYAELSSRFRSEALLQEAIGLMDLVFERLPKQSLFPAGQAFNAYRSAGGTRGNVLADFFIGAHATVARLAILTRDVRRYRAYFPGVELIAP